MMCDEGGAPQKECQDRFNEFLAKEFEDLSYGRVHHLTVCTFMLQHSSRLTPAGWLHERGLLREFLVENKPPVLIREERREQLDSGSRDFKVRSQDGLPVIPRTQWTRTVLDVRMQDAATYCEDVIAWASATLDDSERIKLG